MFFVLRKIREKEAGDGPFKKQSIISTPRKKTSGQPYKTFFVHNLQL